RERRRLLGRRRQRPRPASRRCGGAVAAGLRSEVAALVELAGAEQLEALVEQHLEILLAAALEEHVPVGAHGLAGLRLGLLVVTEHRGGTAAAFPDGGDVGLDREGEDDVVAVGAVVDGLLARCGEVALVVLGGEVAQSGASAAAAVHAVLASCRGWVRTARRPSRFVDGVCGRRGPMMSTPAGPVLFPRAGTRHGSAFVRRPAGRRGA